jgi:hypothetical protein
VKVFSLLGVNDDPTASGYTDSGYRFMFRVGVVFCYGRLSVFGVPNEFQFIPFRRRSMSSARCSGVSLASNFFALASARRRKFLALLTLRL